MEEMNNPIGLDLLHGKVLKEHLLMLLQKVNQIFQIITSILTQFCVMMMLFLRINLTLWY
jgi:hypothetical protein